MRRPQAITGASRSQGSSLKKPNVGVDSEGPTACLMEYDVTDESSDSGSFSFLYIDYTYIHM